MICTHLAQSQAVVCPGISSGLQFLQVVFHPLMYLNGILRGGSPLPPRETAPPVSHADRHSPKSWAFSLLSSRLVLHQHPVLPPASAPSFPDEAANSACCHGPEESRAGSEDAAAWEGKGVTDFQFTTGARVGAGGGRGGLVDIVNGSRNLSACNSILSPGHCFLNHHE